MRHYILTGTPGSGKTTILAELKRLGYVVVEEAATDVIASEHKAGNPEPWRQPNFIDKIIQLQKQRQLAASGPPDDILLFDRSPICTLALSRYLGYEDSPVLLKELERIQLNNIYQKQVFFIENLGFCVPTEARKITFEESLHFERIHEEIYTGLGYELIKVAPVPIMERVSLITEQLKSFQYDLLRNQDNIQRTVRHRYFASGPGF